MSDLESMNQNLSWIKTRLVGSTVSSLLQWLVVNVTCQDFSQVHEDPTKGRANLDITEKQILIWSFPVQLKHLFLLFLA